MILLINSYSFVFVGLLVLSVIGFLAWRMTSLQWTAAIVTCAFAFLVGFQFVASTKGNTISSPEAFYVALKSGQPVLLELYSNFCIACLQAKPAVDRLERELQDQFRVIRLDVSSNLGEYLRNEYEGGIVPTFIVFDREGNETWRQTGSVPPIEIIRRLEV